jgi:hypothetical protein
MTTPDSLGSSLGPTLEHARVGFGWSNARRCRRL